MKKVSIIHSHAGFQSADEVPTGGLTVARSNFDFMEKLFGKENIFLIGGSFRRIGRSNLLKRGILQLIFFAEVFVGRFFFSGFTKKQLECIRISDILFFDSIHLTTYCRQAKQINPDIKIINFCHNVETDMICLLHNLLLQKAKKSLPTKIKNRVYVFLEYREFLIAEDEAMRYSDIILTISTRDQNTLVNRYGSNKRIIPVYFSIEDKWNSASVSKVVHPHPILLFVGSNYEFNIQGLIWFITHVMPHVEATLFLVGKNLEHVTTFPKHDRVKIIGTTTDLEKYYYESDIVISPILQGGGLKVKIMEALMYGKTILGTSESFAGYELDYDRVGGCCNTKEEFIEKITSWKKEDLASVRHNAYSRYIYQTKYSKCEHDRRMNEAIQSL